MLIPILIFAATYLVLAIGRLPGFRVDRTGAAIIGASLMLAANVLTMKEAYAAIDYDTIMLLFGMMIVVANLRLSGFFALVSAWVVEHAHRPLLLLAGIVLVSGVFSAFFVNDTMCLVLTPLVLEITGRLRRNPIPYLLAVAMAANIGSAATITGNPQNMMIGSFSHIGYRAFAAALAPIAAAGLGLTVAAIALVYRSEFRADTPIEVAHAAVRVHRALLIEIAGRLRCHDRLFLHRLAGAQGCRHRRRSAVADPAHQTGKGLPGNRLEPAGDVHRPLHRVGGSAEDSAGGGLLCRRPRATTWSAPGR